MGLFTGLFSLALAQVVLGGDNAVTRILGSDGAMWSYEGTVYVERATNRQAVLYTGDADSTAFLVRSNASNVTIGVFRMRHAQVLDTVLPSPYSYAIIPFSAVREITILYSVYNTDFVFYGRPPVEFELHLNRESCIDGEVDLLNDGISPKLADVLTGDAVWVDVTATHHVLANASLCGTVFQPHESIRVIIDCDSSTVLSDTTRLSAPLLELGVYRVKAGTRGHVCLYTPDHKEIDYTWAMAVVWGLVGILVTWVAFTQGALTTSTAEKQVMHLVTVEFVTMAYDVLFLVWSMNLYSAAQQSHTIYGFSVMRVVSRTVVDATVDIFAYVVCTCIGAGSLVAITIGAVIHDAHKTRWVLSQKFGTWGLTRLESVSLGVRVGIFSVIMAIVCGVVVGVWYGVLNDTAAMGVTLGTAIVSTGHMATPAWFTSWVLNRVVGFVRYDRVLMVYIRWSVEYLVLTCIMFNFPSDVVGTLSLPFHTGFMAAIGLAVVIITARDFAVMSAMLTLRWERHLLHPFVIFTVWFVALFGISPAYSNTDALGNKGSLALYPAMATTSLVFSGMYAWFSTKTPLFTSRD